MTTPRTAASVSRRTAIAGLGTGGLGLAVAATARPAAAQDAAGDLAGHPMTGVWMGMANPPLPDAPQIASPAIFAADGSVLLMFPLTQAGPEGVQFNSASVGTWEADDDRTAHFTAVQSLSNANGTFLGTITVDGYPEASEDGQTFIDDGSRVLITVRDPAGAVVAQFPDTSGRPVTGTRIGPGNPGFPEDTPDTATPTL